MIFRPSIVPIITNFASCKVRFTNGSKFGLNGCYEAGKYPPQHIRSSDSVLMKAEIFINTIVIVLNVLDN